ncbi:hypothetical protein WAI87_21070, partial [Acinetobacter baumannii]
LKLTLFGNNKLVRKSKLKYKINELKIYFILLIHYLNCDNFLYFSLSKILFKKTIKSINNI